MDTTQDSRENAGKRRPQTGGQNRASQRPGQSAPEQRRRPAEQSAQERPRRPAEQNAPEQRRRAPERNAQERPRRPAEQDARRRPGRQERPDRPVGREAQPRQRAGEETAARQRAKQSAGSRKGAPRRRPVDDDVPNRKRAYGNSKPKKKSALAMLAETLMSAKKRPKKRPSRKTESSRPKTPTPAVIYTQPLPFNRDRLIVQLITVTAVVLAIVMGLSVFFKVKTITVTGAETYSPWAVREASGISEGDKLLTFSKIRAASQIMANLPYVKGVRIGIKLPDTVNIMIEEESVVYAIKSSDGQWWMMDSDGRVVEQANNAKAATATQVLGVTLEAPAVNQKGIATEATPSETNELGELIPVTTTGAQRLTAALQILKALEDNDIVGEAASVDVTSTEDIILWYGTRYQVNLGDTSRLDYKVDCMNDAILQMSDYQSGVLDVSFTVWPNQVGYTPFA
ncbi:MAG TPA: hypothetical protein DDY90_08495 [Clostridiales bacterium]|nr:hypothetical protein [Clostridiales bacterium]